MLLVLCLNQIFLRDLKYQVYKLNLFPFLLFKYFTCKLIKTESIKVFCFNVSYFGVIIRFLD